MLVNKFEKGFNFYKYNFKSESVGGGTSSLVSQRLVSQRLVSQRLVSQRHGREGLSSLVSQRLVSQRLGGGTSSLGGDF